MDFICQKMCFIFCFIELQPIEYNGGVVNENYRLNCVESIDFCHQSSETTREKPQVVYTFRIILKNFINQIKYVS